MVSDEASSGLQPEFVQRLTAGQSALYAFVVSLMGRTDEAHDVLQEANLKLCRKAAEYDESQPFLRWAYVFARYEVMAWRKRQQRSKLVLDDELVAAVADEMEQDAEAAEHRLRALEQCVRKLPDHQQALVTSRYGEGEALQAMAARLAQPENALAALFYRVRKALAACIEETLQQGGGIKA